MNIKHKVIKFKDGALHKEQKIKNEEKYKIEEVDIKNIKISDLDNVVNVSDDLKSSLKEWINNPTKKFEFNGEIVKKVPIKKEQGKVQFKDCLYAKEKCVFLEVYKNKDNKLAFLPIDPFGYVYEKKTKDKSCRYSIYGLKSSEYLYDVITREKLNELGYEFYDKFTIGETIEINIEGRIGLAKLTGCSDNKLLIRTLLGDNYDMEKLTTEEDVQKQKNKWGDGYLNHILNDSKGTKRILINRVENIKHTNIDILGFRYNS